MQGIDVNGLHCKCCHLSEQICTDYRLPPIFFAQKASGIEFSAIQCNFSLGTCQSLTHLQSLDIII
jgi:hypothetical protein